MGGNRDFAVREWKMRRIGNYEVRESQNSEEEWELGNWKDGGEGLGIFTGREWGFCPEGMENMRRDGN